MMTKARAVFLVAVCIVCSLMCTVPCVSAELEPPDAFVTQFDPPDPSLLSSALQGVEKYRSTRQFKDQWKITTNREEGIIQTNWYPEHKGEVRLKVQVAVWGKHYRVDVWQKLGLLWKRADKTEGSRRVERQIQETIEEIVQGIGAEKR